MSKLIRFVGYEHNGTTVIGRRVFTSPMSVQDSFTDEIRLIHVVNGESLLISADTQYPLRSGDTLLLKSDNFINTWKESEEPVDFLLVRLTRETLHLLFQTKVPDLFKSEQSLETKKVLSSVIRLQHEGQLAAFIESLKAYSNGSQPVSEELAEAKLREIIHILPNAKTQDAGEDISVLMSQVFSQANPDMHEVIKTHLFSPLKVDELAFLCNMSASTFNRKFKAAYNTSPNRYLLTKRLEKAKQRLISTTDNLTRIAADCGFEDQSYFSRVFRQEFNRTPSEYRKSPD